MDDRINRLTERVADLERQVEALRARLEGHPFTEIEPETELEPAAETELENPPMEEPVWPPMAPHEPVVRPPELPLPVPSSAAAAFDWRTKLRAWNLWPPEGEGSFEVQLGAWWATRIGALLAVIGVVFFGVYIAHGTPPWVRLAQLAGIALAVTAAGHWLERRQPKFGSVVFGGGLALIFFTGFAAYAIPAVKVIDHPLLATGVQGLTVMGLGWASFWKNRSGLATMAILFGFVTCFFSFVEQLHDISLVAAFFLSVAGAGLWVSKSWIQPLACSLPAAYVIYGTIVLFGWSETPPETIGQTFAFPVGLFLLHAALDYVGLKQGWAPAAPMRRLLQACNAAGAAGLGLWAAVRYFPELVAPFYFLFAAIFLGGAWLYWRQDRTDEMGHVWFAAGTGFLALGLIEILGARTRWVALGVQGLVVLAVTRRTRLWTGEAAMGILWFASAGLFFYDTAQSGLLVERGAFASWWGLAAGTYLVISGVLVGLQGKWFARLPIPGGEPVRVETVSPPGRVELNVLYSLVLGGVAVAAAWAGFAPGYFPVGAIFAAILLAAGLAATRHWAVLAGVALPFGFAQWTFWGMIPGFVGEPGFGLSGGTCVGTALAAAAAAQYLRGRGRLPEPWGLVLTAALHGVWLISLQMLLAGSVSLETNLLVAAGVGLILLFLAGWRRFDFLPDLALMPVALVFVVAVKAGFQGWGVMLSGGMDWMLWAAALVAFATVSLRDSWQRVDGLAGVFPSPTVSRWIGASGATVLVVYLLVREFDLPHLMAACGSAGVAVLLLAHWPGWRAAVASAFFIIVVGHIAFLVSLGPERSGDVGWALSLGVLTIVCGILCNERSIVDRTSLREGLQWAFAVLAVGSLFLLFWTRTGPLQPYVTVFWGITAISVFASGLVWRIRPMRVVGLIGLALCLPRVFLVDIHSTFYRIAAFGVIGLVLLVVGYSYHRFRGYLNPPAKDEVGSTGNDG